MRAVSAHVDAVDLAHTQTLFFLELPAELRNKMYALLLLVSQVIDLDPTNYRVLAPRLLFLVSRRLHAEAYPIFYGDNAFRIFPIHTRFYYTKSPLLARLAPQYLAVMKTLDLRLGPGHCTPVRGWTVTPNLRLTEAVKVRVLKVFVENDPSYDGYYRFNKAAHPYMDFAGRLVNNIFNHLPQVEEVVLDGFRPRQKPSPLISRVDDEARTEGKKITWGLLRGWSKDNGHICTEQLTANRNRDWSMVDFYGDESLDRLLKLLVMS
ncbi:MAG: hypothetical protein M1836_006808 [Candelina mexicana]|nr:MAG: hypothetical protein M1836_006808 [Candelina mexicana]